MGSTPSKPRAVASIRTQTTNSAFESSPLPVEQPSRPHQPIIAIQRHQPRHQHQHQYHHQHVQDPLDWPLPPKEEWPTFKLANNDSDRYLLSPLPPESASSGTSPRLVESTPNALNHRDSKDKDWEKQTDSRIFDSAHIQSQLSARFHAYFNLAPTENINAIMDSLKNTHKDLDLRLNRRLILISAQAELKLTLILSDSKKEQNRLLAYDEERQTRQDELYQQWLQKYVVQLNKWRSEELARLQRQLLVYQKQIVDNSKYKIDQLNAETNELKTQILEEEQARVLRKSTKIIDKIYVSTDEAYHLGSESKTEFNLRVQANVGKIAPEQRRTNDRVDT